MTDFRFIQSSTNNPISSFYGCVLSHCIYRYHIFFIYSSVDEHLSCSHVLARRKQWHLTPVLLPGKSHGRRSLVGCSPWGRKEWDTTERLPFQLPLSCIGERNANPLQCSCLENPRDREPGGLPSLRSHRFGHN